MIPYLTFNKDKKKTVILVHGLFTREGFWLEYLTHFKGYKIIILKVDYMTLQIDKISEHITLIIKNECRGHNDLLITHSLGSIISECLKNSAIKYIFNVAPVVNARRLNGYEFKNSISSSLNDKIPKDEIELMLKNADDLIIKTRARGLNKQQTSFLKNLIPTHDEYFNYDGTKNIQIFKGDHFNIEEALNKIMKLIKYS
tara:strand:+ start:9427 stop:10026 length:600 start_codon:yes stop_codon:yes gene_type:complete